MNDNVSLGLDPDRDNSADAVLPIQTEQYFLIRMGASLYGIAARHVQHASTVVRPVRVPSAPSCFLGVVHERGQIVAVVDLATLLNPDGISPADGGSAERAASAQRLVVLRVARQLFAVIADAVLGIRSIDVGSIRAEQEAAGTGVMVAGVDVFGGRFEVLDGEVIILDVEALRAALAGDAS